MGHRRVPAAHRSEVAAVASVVVADDDVNIRELVAYRLRRDGHTVTTAEDGVQAVDLTRSGHPDVIVLDVMMPGLSGLDAARLIRESPELSEARIILLTARTQESDVAQGYAVGVDDYVTKPFSPLELSLRVTAVLARSR